MPEPDQRQQLCREACAGSRDPRLVELRRHIRQSGTELRGGNREGGDGRLRGGLPCGVAMHGGGEPFDRTGSYLGDNFGTRRGRRRRRDSLRQVEQIGARVLIVLLCWVGVTGGEPLWRLLGLIAGIG